MRGFIPPKPTGTTREARFMQAVWDHCFGPSERIGDSDTVKVSRTSKCILLHARAPKNTTSEPGIVRQFRYKSSSNDYITCVKWDGTDEGEETIIAKPYLLRNEDSVITLPDGSHSYTSTGADTRTNAVTSSNPVLSATYTEQIWPPYTEDDLIYATEPEGGTDVEVEDEPITWQDLNVDARAWAWKDSGCIGGVPAWMYIVGSKPFPAA